METPNEGVMDDATPASSVDICSDEEPAVPSGVAASADELAVASQQSTPTGEADGMKRNVEEPHERPQSDEPVGDGAELLDAAAGVQEMDSSAEVCSGTETGEGVTTDTVVDAEQRAAENDLQSEQVDTAAADNGEEKSSEIPPHVSDSSTDAVHDAGKIDWDALGKPKQKSFVEENAEFSQVFNKVVKPKSTTENRDSAAVTAQSSTSSPTDLSVSSSDLYAKSAATQLPSVASKAKTEDEVRKAEKHETSPSSRKDEKQIVTDKSLVTVGQQAVSIEPLQAATFSSSSAVSSAYSRQLSPTAKDSTVVTKTKSQDEDTKPSSTHKYAAVAHETESHDEDTKPSSPCEESPAVQMIPGIEDTSPGKESSVVIKVEPPSEDLNPSASSDSSETNECTEGMDLSSSDEASSAVTMTKLCSEVADLSSSGTQFSCDLTKAGPPTESTSLQSRGSECSTVTETKPCDISVKQQVEDIHDPQSDKQAFNPTEPEGKGSLEPNEAKLMDSSLNISSVIPTENAGPYESSTSLDIDASDRLVGEQRPSVDVSEINREEENASGACSQPSSYVAKPVPAQQKQVISRRSAAKVQPSELKTEEPAWAMAARHTSAQWSESRAEEFERKPEKPAADVDEEVRPVLVNLLTLFSFVVCHFWIFIH